MESAAALRPGYGAHPAKGKRSWAEWTRIELHALRQWHGRTYILKKMGSPETEQATQSDHGVRGSVYM